jgi:hypothetical protein
VVELPQELSAVNGRSTPSGPLVPEPPEIRSQLQRILESPSFKTSNRCSSFLRHVVEGACSGEADLLKERNLGVAVFDRDPDYDTNQDPVVRNTAGQVRKRLAQYYCEPGRDRELRIDLPPGSYVPEIHKPVAPVSIAPPEPVPDRSVLVSRWLIAAAIVLILCVAGFLWQRQTKTEMDLFWAPLLEHPGAVVLCVGQGHTYKLAEGLDRLFEDSAGMPRQLQTGTIPLTDVIPAWDRYVGLTDVQALMRLSALFAKFNKNVELRGGRVTSLADLRGRPSVLVGAFNNDWTLSLTGELRFYFDTDPEHKLEIVRDRLHPDNRSWEVRSDLPPTRIPMDYAIVTRVFNHTTEQAIVVAAGIRGGGTSAAGEFLTNPAYLVEALRTAPANWDQKNVQFVLSTRMFSGNPGPPRVLAAHYW